MNYLFYTEGHSEFNFIQIFLRHKDIPFTQDPAEVLRRGQHFLKNCQGDSSIFPSIKSDQSWLRECPGNIIIAADCKNCYTEYRKTVKEFLDGIDIDNQFKIINSRPAIEQIYLEDIDLLKNVMRAYHNQESPNKKIDQFDEMRGASLLQENCETGGIIKKILKENGIGMSKKDFSLKFFENAFQQNKGLSIIQRIESLITAQMT